MHDADEMPAKQSGNLSTMQRLRGDRPFTIQYIYFKPLSKAPYYADCLSVHLKGKVHAIFFYEVHLQSVMFNTFKEIYLMEY